MIVSVNVSVGLSTSAEMSPSVSMGGRLLVCYSL